MFLKIFLIVAVFLGIMILGMGINVFFRKKRFPDGSISKNKDMRQKGITCAKHDEMHSCGLGGGCCGSAETLDK
jgi:hypothetical protein